MSSLNEYAASIEQTFHNIYNGSVVSADTEGLLKSASNATEIEIQTKQYKALCAICEDQKKQIERLDQLNKTASEQLASLKINFETEKLERVKTTKISIIAIVIASISLLANVIAALPIIQGILGHLMR